MLSLTVFQSIFDNDTSTRVDFKDFNEFERALYHLSTLPGYKPKKGEFSKKRSPLISPAIYAEGTTRANANVVCWAKWAAIDVDDHEFKGDLENELRSRYSDWRFICYSTASSSSTWPKFRLVFSLDEAVQSSDIKHFWFALNSEFESMGDKQTKDLSRMYYVPAIYPGAHNFIFSNHGRDISVRGLLEKWPWKEANSSASFIDRLPPEIQKEVIKHRESKLKEQMKDISWTSYHDCPFVNKRLISEYKSIAGQDGSGRYSMIYKIMTSTAINAIKSKYPINEYELADIVRNLDRDTSNIYAKRPLNVEASRAIEWAYKNSF
jgi:hypothetical protein